jgi:wyosine [tRNA(Phe)-imidazoG37] synthetase (radical SAM superfamily)
VDSTGSGFLHGGRNDYFKRNREIDTILVEFRERIVLRYIFGPVKSRRFGLSLGVDLSPELKQCNFDCLYCELKGSLNRFHKQRVTVSSSEILDEIREALEKYTDIDVLTFTANGEPSLYSDLQNLIQNVNLLKEQYSFKTLILSNGGNIFNRDIQKSLLLFDKVKLSIDSATDRGFKRIDRPIDGISIEDIKSGVVEFSSRFGGELYLETLFVDSINTTDDEVRELNSFYKRVKQVERIDLGSIDRPPAYDVKGLSYEQLIDIAESMDSSLPILVTKKRDIPVIGKEYSRDEIVKTLQKRPLSDIDVENLFIEESKIELDSMVEDGTIHRVVYGGVTFFKVSEK